jgi:hypothetical protein
MTRNIITAFIALLFVLVSFETASFAQTVKLTPKEQVYKRAGNIVGEKKSFKIRRPIATAATPELSKKITALIDPVNVLEINIKEETNEHQWLYEADYEEVYNEGGILTMMFWMEGSAAYMSSVTKYVVIDTVNGRRLSPADVFIDLPALTAAVKKKQDARVEEGILDIKTRPDWDPKEDPRYLFQYTDFTEKELSNFVVDMAGVAFFYEFGFGNAIKALAPDGEFRFTWAEISPFIKRDGLLGRFAR